MAGAGVPELDAAVLGSRHDPVGVGGEGDGKNKVLAEARYVSTTMNRTTETALHWSLTLCPSKVLTQRPPLGPLPPCGPRTDESSHILMVLSRLPLTSSLPLGEKATLYTLSLWPSGPS